MAAWKSTYNLTDVAILLLALILLFPEKYGSITFYYYVCSQLLDATFGVSYKKTLLFLIIV